MWAKAAFWAANMAGFGVEGLAGRFGVSCRVWMEDLNFSLKRMGRCKKNRQQDLQQTSRANATRNRLEAYTFNPTPQNPNPQIAKPSTRKRSSPKAFHPEAKVLKA